MGSISGIRRIVAGVFVAAMAAGGLIVSAGVAGAQEAIEPGPEPNCVVPGDGRLLALEPVPGPVLREIRCATLAVTKAVNGTAPEGTIFRVVVQCERPDRGMLPPVRTAELPPALLAPFSTVLEFPATGGTQELLVGPGSCEFSESPPPGCTLAGIEPSAVEITAPNRFEVLVTNNCTPPPPPLQQQQQQAQAQQIVVNQPPAASPVVVARPRFTG